MMKSVILILLALAAAGCMGPEAAPSPDPIELERLLSTLEAQASAPPAPAAAPAVPKPAHESLGKADRLVGSLEKMPSDGLDPSLAEALIAR